ncbi:putative membrane protein, partial [Smittium culicis]
MARGPKNSSLDEKIDFYFENDNEYKPQNNAINKRSPLLPLSANNSPTPAPSINIFDTKSVSTAITITSPQTQNSFNIDMANTNNNNNNNSYIETATGFSKGSDRTRSTSVSKASSFSKELSVDSIKKKVKSNFDSYSENKKKSQSKHLDTSNKQDDFWNIVLLIALYWLQGIPLGLSSGSIPFLLKEKMSFSQLGLFSLASYPYSLKLFWSPIVDSIFSNRFGRRKSWIVPVQFAIAAIFWFFGNHVDDLIKNPGPNITTISLIFFVIVLLSATQDIAVDGWALTLLSKENLAYASTCQTIGLNCGYFLSFTVFLAFNTVDFSNKYFRSVPLDYGLVQLGQYMRWWA